MWKIVDIKRRAGRGRQLKENEISCHNKQDNYSVTFSQPMTRALVEGGFNYVELAVDDVTLEMALKFSRTAEETESPIRLVLAGSKKGNGNMTFASKEVMRHIAGYLSEERPDWIAEVSENISRRAGIYFVKILNVVR